MTETQKNEHLVIAPLIKCHGPQGDPWTKDPQGQHAEAYRHKALRKRIELFSNHSQKAILYSS